MKFINIDQKHRGQKNASRAGKSFLMAFILLVCFIAASGRFGSTKAAPSPAWVIVGAISDDLMSTERAEFMVLFENGEVFDEGDMQ